MPRKARTYRLDLTRIDLNHPDSCRDQFPPQRIRKCPHGGLRGTVDTSTWVPLSSRNTANVDDIALPTLTPCRHPLHHLLRHRDQPGYVRVEHNLDVLRLDRRALVDSFDQTSIVDENIDLREFRWQTRDERGDLTGLTEVEARWVAFHASADLGLDLGGKLLKSFETAGSQDQFEVVGRGTSEFEGGRLADAAGGTGDEDGLAFKAFAHGGRHGAELG